MIVLEYIRILGVAKIPFPVFGFIFNNFRRLLLPIFVFLAKVTIVTDNKFKSVIRPHD